jgi:hypothetical protein
MSGNGTEYADRRAQVPGGDALFVISDLGNQVFPSWRHSLASSLGLPNVRRVADLERRGELLSMIERQSQVRRDYAYGYGRAQAELRVARHRSAARASEHAAAIRRGLAERAPIRGSVRRARAYLELRRQP